MAKRVIAATALGAVALVVPARLARHGAPPPPRLAPASSPAPARSLPVARVTAPPASARGPSDVDEILASVARLASDDQAGLTRLFEAMKRWIARDPDGAHAELRSRIPSFSGDDTQSTFFLLHSFLHFGDRPQEVVGWVLDATAPPGRHVHGGPLTPAEQLRRAQSFALRDFRLALPTAARGSAPSLVARLEELAAREPSLDIAREAVLLLARLAPQPGDAVAEALARRTPDERALLAP